MSNVSENAYDEVPYPSGARSHAHPDRLATAALLFGLEPASVEHCRVLEIGCGDGGNLVPIAHQLPGSRCVGIDAAGQPVSRGRAMAAELGLRNVELLHRDVTQVGDELGRFDYILVHGVFSWVGPEIRRRILTLCRDLVEPQGVAFISYNAQPGGHIRNIVRDMMLFHTREIPDGAERVQQARALVKFVAEARQGGDAFRLLMHSELDRIRALEPNYLFHDDLSEWNTPYYFVEFVGWAAEHGLQFLAETDFFEMQDSHLPAATRAELAKLGSNRILHQQYLDFIKCRRFRQTLLCPAALKVADHPLADAVSRLCIASKATLRSLTVDLSPGVTVQWESPRGIKLDSPFPPTKAALDVLARAWPERLTFAELLTRTRAVLLDAGVTADAGDTLPGILCRALLQIHPAGFIDLHAFSPAVARAPGERPVADPVARWQAARFPYATNRHHEIVALGDPLSRRLVPLLDGSRTRETLAGLVDEFRRESPPAPDETNPEDATMDPMGRVDRYLRELARAALFIPSGDLP